MTAGHAIISTVTIGIRVSRKARSLFLKRLVGQGHKIQFRPLALWVGLAGMFSEVVSYQIPRMSFLN
jgi:hypothetical protein